MLEAGHGPMIGHVTEANALEAALAQASAGHGGTVLLSGDPGMGKSRLAEHLESLALARGATVAWGRAWEAGGAPPFWPWVEVLRSVLEPLPVDALRRHLGHGASDIVHLVPELAERMELPAAAPLAPGAERFRLFDAVASLLVRSAQTAPIVVLLDDLHAADESSLLLLAFAAPRLVRSRVLVLGTYREREARLAPQVDALLGKVARAARSLRVSPLGLPEIDALLRASGLPATGGLVERLAETTEGNALFVTESIRLLRARWDEGSTLDRVPIPDSVRGAIRDHLGRVEPGARQLLEAGAVVGREFTDALVAQVTGVPIDEVRRGLTEAERQGILSELGVGRYRFLHVLVRDVLYDDAEALRRSVLHVRVAEALEDLHGIELGSPLAEIGQHFARAGAGFSLRAVDTWSLAASRASEKLAFEEAVSLLERASALLDAVAPQELPRRLELLLSLGAARMASGRLQGARDACLAAADLARSLQSAEGLAQAALVYGSRLMLAVRDPVLIQLLGEALDRLPPGDSALRARAMARLAAALQPSHDPREPIQMARESLAMARRVGDPKALLAVLNGTGSSLADFAPPHERFAVDAELVELATSLGDKPLALRGLSRLVIDLLEIGDLPAMESRINAYEALAAEFRLPHVQWQGHLFRSIRPLLEGRFDEAIQLEEQAVALAQRCEDPNAAFVLPFHRLARARIAGDMPSLIELSGQVLANMDLTIPVTDGAADYWRASIYASVRDEERTRAALPRLIDKWVIEESSSFLLMGDILTLVRDAERAAYFLDEGKARHRPEALSIWGMAGIATEGPVGRTFMLMAAVAGRWDEAEAHYERARAQGEQLRARPFLARLELDWALQLAQRGAEGDAERAGEHASAAAERAEALGLTDMAARARALAEQVVRTSVAPVAPAPSEPAIWERVQEAKLASLADLVAGIAHEINNPLGALQSSADVSRRAFEVFQQALHDPELAAVVQKNPKLSRALEVLDKTKAVTPEATQRIARVVRELKSFAWLDRAEVDRVDLRESLDASVSVLGHELDDRITIVRRYSDVQPVQCRPREMHEALLHLVKNAAQAIAGLGTITLEVSPDGGGVLVRVSDDGSGITPEHLPRIFDPGFTTRGVGVGIGIGLAIVYRVVREHGGTVEVTSAVGQGSAFTVRLPAGRT